MNLAWSAEAVNDLDAAVDYISNDLGSPRAAEDLFKSMVDKAQLFASFPEAATVLRTQTGIDTGYRYVTSGKWMVFFSIEESSAIVVRILYGGSDYLKTLFERADR